MKNTTLNIPQILQGMPKYCILRIPQRFPAYKVPSDIDILCKDLTDCVEFLESKLDLVKIDRFGRQIQLDYMVNGKLELKFDLYGHYISEKFKREALRSRIRSKGVYVAHEYHDNLSKCYEFFTHNKSKYVTYQQFKRELDAFTN